jgi:hypothetical protein
MYYPPVWFYTRIYINNTTLPNQIGIKENRSQRLHKEGKAVKYCSGITGV